MSADRFPSAPRPFTSADRARAIATARAALAEAGRPDLVHMVDDTFAGGDVLVSWWVPDDRADQALVVRACAIGSASVWPDDLWICPDCIDGPFEAEDTCPLVPVRMFPLVRNHAECAA